MRDAAAMHAKAMELYDAALIARRSGNEEEFRLQLNAALQEETAAATQFAAETDLEPTRSILFRSAATLALTAYAFDKALELSAAGLAGTAPATIRAELVGLVKEANYRLHILETEGITIGDESLTLSLEGEAVGNGMVRHEVFKTKLNAVVNMINRTADRVRGFAFGEASRKEFTAPLYISPPIPGSFAIEMRLGDQRQPDLNGLPQSMDVGAVLNEVVECFKEFKEGDLDALRGRIRSSDYFDNFMALSRQLQPDGDKITAVELVGNLHKGIKRVRVTTPRPKPERKKSTEGGDESEIVEITGILRFAEKRAEGKERVAVVDDRGDWHEIHVPAALMADVVRPLWDERVTIVARRGRRQSLELESIDLAA